MTNPKKKPSQEVRESQERLAFRAGVGGGGVIRIGGGDSNAGKGLAADDLEHVLAAPHAALHIQVLPGQQLGCHGTAVQQRLLLQAMECQSGGLRLEAGGVGECELFSGSFPASRKAFG